MCKCVFLHLYALFELFLWPFFLWLFFLANFDLLFVFCLFVLLYHILSYYIIYASLFSKERQKGVGNISVEAQKCEPISTLSEGQRVLACSKLLSTSVVTYPDLRCGYLVFWTLR